MKSNPDASITLSPVYLAAASYLGGERGLSIRFPRFMRLREDKSWEQASTSAQFAEMYRNQIKEAPARAVPGEVVIRKNSEERDVPNPSSDPVELDDEDEGEEAEEDEEDEDD